MERRELIARLASEIRRVRARHPVRVAIDGVEAAGKTTLADELVAPLERGGASVIRSSIDGFHHPRALRHRRGATSPEGYYADSFDGKQLVGALLEPLGPGGSRRYRRAVFDYRLDAPVEAPLEEARADAILLFDGVFLMRPELRERWDLSIFVRVDFGVALERAERRDLALFGGPSEVRRRYEQRYIPAQRRYLAESLPERLASIAVDNNDPLQPLIEFG
ncbi:MAG: uridine kinase [Myxococcota bacterium]